jgi:hypothetical protein
VSTGVMSNLSDILPHVDDASSLIFWLANPTAKFMDWRMRLYMSQQLRKSAPFFDRSELFDCAYELLKDDVAAVRNDAAVSFTELETEDNGSVVQDLANSENHWTRLGIAKVFRKLRPKLGRQWRDVLRPRSVSP